MAESNSSGMRSNMLVNECAKFRFLYRPAPAAPPDPPNAPMAPTFERALAQAELGPSEMGSSY